MRDGIRERLQVAVGCRQLRGLLTLAPLQRGVLNAQAPHVKGPGDGRQNDVHPERLEHVIQRADLQRGDRRIDGPCPVMTTPAMSGSLSCAARISSMPSISGIIRSVSSRSHPPAVTVRSAAAGEEKPLTW